MKRKIQATTIVISCGFLGIVLYAFMMIGGYQTAAPDSGNKQDKEGYYIFYTLLKRLGYTVKKTGTLGGHLKSGCLIYPDWDKEDAAVYTKLTDWLDRGNTLFLGIPAAAVDPVLSIDIAACAPEIIEPADSVKTGVRTVSYTANRCFTSVKDGDVLVSISQGAVLFSKSAGPGRLYLCTEPAMFNNSHIQDKELAVLCNNIFSPFYNETIYLFDSALTIGRAASPVLVLFKGKLFFITIHLLLIAVLFFFKIGKRFGLPAQLNPYTRRSLDEHIQAAGMFYYRAKAFALVDSYESRYFLFNLRKFTADMRTMTNAQLIESITTRYAVEPALIAELTAVHTVLNAAQLLDRIKQRRKVLEQIRNKKTDRFKGV